GQRVKQSRGGRAKEGWEIGSHVVTSRLGSNNEMGWPVVPSMARSARISPTMGTNLKPWPENPHATVTFSESGWRAMTKCSSGVLEYMQVAECRHGPSSAGTSW